MIKRMIIMLLLCGLVLGGVFGYKAFGHKMMMKYMAAAGSAPQTVSTVRVAPDSWQPEMRVIGTIRAMKGVDISPEVAGTVNTIQFESGDDVEEGKLLLRLQDGDDVARLHALEAAARLAELTLERNRKQLKAQAISQAAVDSDAAALDAAKAQAEAQRIMLEKKTLRAPFSGRLGIRNVDVGQYLTPGTPVVTLQQLDPIYVDFYVPEHNLPHLQAGQKASIRIDAFPDKLFEGEVSAINAKVEPNTRNVLVRAAFKNPEKQLLPGMFATVTLAMGQPRRYLTLPQTAITFNPYGSTVFVVQDKGLGPDGQKQLIAMSKFVETGLTRGDQIAVVSGLEEGEEIVTAGQLKLRNGTLVSINNSVQPENNPSPSITDR